MGSGMCWWFVLLFSCAITVAKKPFPEIGCRVVGYTRTISIPNCVEFPFSSNACEGYCQSWAFPSSPAALLVNPRQNITSISQCCDIEDTEDFKVNVSCLTGMREFIFKSAKSCICSDCKKD